jgi:hypothetical protein
MSVASGFDSVQVEANASPEAVKEGRRRRDVFSDALEGLDDVVEVVPSGSLARSTHKDPIHDVDLLVIFDFAQHPEWVQPGKSAEEALEHTRSETKRLLGNFGEDGKEVRITGLRNHSVKCFLDKPDATDAFSVDLTPAIRRSGGGLWIPEKNSEDWISSDPEKLIEMVAARHAEWNQFRPLVRVLKLWNAVNGKVMKSLVVEVLALVCLRISEDRGQALEQFFTGAATAVTVAVCDPTGHCGEIQPKLDKQRANEVLLGAADLAWRANAAAARDEIPTARCLWNQVFGDAYPKPPGGCKGTGASAVGAAAAGSASLLARPKRPIRDAPQG